MQDVVIVSTLLTLIYQADRGESNDKHGSRSAAVGACVDQLSVNREAIAIACRLAGPQCKVGGRLFEGSALITRQRGNGSHVHRCRNWRCRHSQCALFLSN
jgi:hypothetical protein